MCIRDRYYCTDKGDKLYLDCWLVGYLLGCDARSGLAGSVCACVTCTCWLYLFKHSRDGLRGRHGWLCEHDLWQGNVISTARDRPKVTIFEHSCLCTMLCYAVNGIDKKSAVNGLEKSAIEERIHNMEREYSITKDIYNAKIKHYSTLVKPECLYACCLLYTSRCV